MYPRNEIMIGRVGWFIASIVVAVLVYLFVAIVMMQVPQTPQGRSFQQFLVVASYRNADNPALGLGNFEFDKWLLFGRQADVTNAIALPIAAALAVILLRKRSPIGSLAEIALAAVAFSAFMWFRGMPGETHLGLLAVIAFSATLLLSVTKLRFRKTLGLALAVLLSIAFAVSWPRGWEIRTSDGSDPCLIATGNSHNQVVGACGPPRRAGGQPKRIGGSIFDWKICSAPCEARGDLLLFFDCDSKLSSVITNTPDDYHGCVWEGPAREGRQP